MPYPPTMSGPVLGVLALLLVAGSMALWFRRIQSVRIPTDRRGFVASWLFGAALGIYALTASPGWLGGIPAAIAAFGGMFFSVLVAISPQRVGEGSIQVGESLRAFTAPDEHGHEFELASAPGKPILLKFFRGHW